MRSDSFILGCAFLLTILTGCSRDDGIPFDKSIAVDTPDLFAQYLNTIASLPAGDYTIVAATNSAGESASFEVTVTFDDGEAQVFNGSWTSSGGQDENDPGNVSYPITQYVAGGINIKLSSDVDTFLYLLDSSGGIFRGMDVGSNDDISVTDTNSQITLEASRIDSESFGAAYYATVDPLGIKTTLQGFKDANGFDVADAAGRVLEPRFRDTKDLGYGRGIRAWTKPDGSAYFFVENFQVRSVPGLEYSALNLEALLGDQRQHHFGTNAIEYSTYPYGIGEPCGPIAGDPGCKTSNPNPPKFLKFFTFDATKGSQIQPDHANEIRLNTVNLDGRGNKAMPGACVYCHGGTLRPLRADGSYRDNSYSDMPGDLIAGNGNGINGDTNAKLQLMEVSSFEFGSASPFTRAEQEPVIKQVNKMIYCTYPGAHESACAEYCVDPSDTTNCDGNGNSVAAVINCVQPDPAITLTIDVSNCDGEGNTLTDMLDKTNKLYSMPGEWTGDFANTMAEGWYDDPAVGDGAADGVPDFDSETFRQEYVPEGWQPDPSDGNPPPGADRLFVEVVQPACFVCHSRRGTNLATNAVANESKDIDFSTYDKFISHADLIEEYVYERGVMPLSLRGYNAFWAGNGPQLLASFLPNFSHANADGSIDQPGAPVADAGPDRKTPSPVRMFGSNSRFVSGYSWEIVSTPVGGEAATLSETTTPAPILAASVDGDYEIRLTVTGAGTSTDQDTVLIKIDNTPALNPKDLIFMAGATCMNSPEEICTIFKTSTGPQPCNDCHIDGGIVAGIPVWWDELQPATGTTWYEEVLARVNFNEPEQSLILTKPSGNHHYGNLRPGFDVENPADRQDYDKMLNWIMEGAREK